MGKRKKKQEPEIKFRTTTITKQIDLTDADRIELGNELAAKEQEWDAVKREAAACAGKYKERLDGIGVRITHLSNIITEGGELRDIEVRIAPDLEAKMIRYLRLESDDVVDERAMTEDELQGGLFDDEPASGETGGTPIPRGVEPENLDADGIPMGASAP